MFLVNATNISRSYLAILHWTAIISGLVSVGCSSSLMSLGEDKQKGRVIDEMRQEIADLHHNLHATKVDLELVQEKVKAQENSFSSFKNQPKNQSRVEFVASQMGLIEKRLQQIEKAQERLSTHANQTTASLVQYREKIQEIEQDIHSQNQRLEEVVKLKATLSSLSNVIQKKPADGSSKIYRVKPGDSLERIARAEGVTVEALKSTNRLENDRIGIGQELRIP